MSADNFDNRKSDQVAIKLLEAIENAGLVDHFKKLKEKHGRYDALQKDGNVLYPVVLREGLFIRNFIKQLGGDEWKWQEKLGMALMYHDKGDSIGAFSSNE